MKKNDKGPHTPVRRATASDVARQAGVSKWTVLRAFTDGSSISEHSLNRVHAIAKELGYQPNLLARSLSKKSTRIIGLVMDELKNPNLTPLLDEVTQQLQQQGYMALLLNITTGYDYKSALMLADRLRVDGLLFLGTVLPSDLVALAKDIHHIPLVQLYRNSDNPYIQVVSTDGYHAGREIAQLLLTQGYQRFGYMSGPATLSTQLLRLDGYSAELTSQGHQVDVILRAPHYQWQNGFEALSRYLRETPAKQRIDALFCENDILAIGAMDALRMHPGEVHLALVGFDNIELSSLPSYQLTTYSQPMELLVPEAIRRLTLDLVPRENAFFAGKLIVRSSHLKQS